MKRVKSSRRDFLKGVAACSCSAMAMGTIPGLGINTANAATGNGTKLVVVNMAGGWDGLQLCQPSSGTLYNAMAAKRPTLITAPGSLLPINSQFGFHPSLTALKSTMDEGSLISLLNVGYANMTRSHKDAELAYARAIVDRETGPGTGFISRLGSVNSWTSLQALSVNGTDPAFEGAAYRGIQVYGLSRYRYGSDGTQSVHETTDRVDTMQDVALSWTLDTEKSKQAEAAAAVDVAVSSSELIYQARQAATFPTAYPNTTMGRSFKDVDILFSSGSLGTQVAYVKRGGFDTHSDQAEWFGNLLPEFNAALTAFIANMKAKNLWSNLIVLVLSEFGRTNIENDSQGTDHGGALPVFLMGGAVNGTANSGLVGTMSVSDISTDGWLPMRINIVDIYRQIVTRMGYSADAMLEPATGSVSSALFT